MRDKIIEKLRLWNWISIECTHAHCMSRDSLVNSLLGDVAPENHSSSKNVIKRCSRFCVVDDGRHFPVVERYFPDVVAAGEEKRSMSLGSFTLRVVTRVPQIARQAFALKWQTTDEIGRGRFPIVRRNPTLKLPRSFVHICEHDPGISHSLMSSHVLLSASWKPGRQSQ